MIRVRKADQRGGADHGWLQTRHTFSFASYYDPQQIGFRSLRVINEDRVRPGRGFGTHHHDNMEIISCVLSGSLEHRDSMGHGEVLHPGELQRISAGSGITHSEFNPSATEPVHFYQIWIRPNVLDSEPTYQQRAFHREEKQGRLRLVASPDGRDGSLSIHQDALMYLSIADGTVMDHDLRPGRYAWVQVISGRLMMNEQELHAGDGAAISGGNRLLFQGHAGSEFMLFDLA